MSKVWLSFSITPVQGYIIASRSVRDLAVSSELLGHLVGAAIDAGWDKGGTLLFPFLDKELKGKRKPHIPNKFVMLFDSEEKAKTAETAETACRIAAFKAWTDIAGAVKNELDNKWRTFGTWDEDWKRQIENYWDIRTFVLEQLTSEQGDLRPTWRRAAAVEGASKHVRFFPAGIGGDVPKCTIFGDWDQMGPRGTLNDMSQFWGLATGTVINPAIVREPDRLCAIALVKRFAASVETAWGSDMMNPSLARSIDDTAAFAVKEWRKGAPEEELKAFDSAVDALNDAGLQSKDRVLLSGWTEGQAWKDDLLKPRDFQTQIESVDTALKALKAKCRDERYPAPSPYYALLKIDVDRLGRLLAGDGKAAEGEEIHVTLTEGYYKTLSTKMRDYAKQAQEIIEKHGGLAVYAGGDECLALLPADTAFQCAKELHDKFGGLAEGIVSTLSGAVVIAHYKENLKSVLSTLNATLDHAKEMGRDACEVRVLKHSGADLQSLVSWDMLPSFSEIAGHLLKGASDGWLATLEEKVQSPLSQNNPLEKEPLRLLVESFLSHAQGDNEHEQRAMKAKVETFWGSLDTFLQDRFTREPTLYPNPTSQTLPYSLRLLDEFIVAMQTASFLARRR